MSTPYLETVDMSSSFRKHVQLYVDKNKLLPEEQKVCRKGSKRNKNCWVILWFCKTVRRDKNLSMAWVDYRKASDMVPHSWIIGTLSKDDDDGGENVGKKMNLRSFKLNRVYLDPLNMSNAGDFSWRFKKMKENSSSYVHVLHKTSN